MYVYLIFQSILIKCLAFSINAKHSGSREKKDHGMKVIHTLMQEVPHLEQYLRTDSLQIMEEMLNAMYDRIKFDQLFHMNVELTNDENAMDHECFIKSMEYIQVNVKLINFTTMVIESNESIFKNSFINLFSEKVRSPTTIIVAELFL